MKVAFYGAAAAAALLMSAATAPAALVFSDDFSEADGTLLNGKTADVGGPWVGTTGAANFAVQGGALNTVGAARVAFAPLTRPLTTGEVLTISFTSDTQNPFTGGYGGLALFSGYTSPASAGTERAFVGDLSNSAAGWGATGGGQTIQSTNTSLPATVKLTYAYDTGAAQLFVNNASVGTATFATGGAINAVRISNDSGGDIKVDNLTIDASAVPEPGTIGVAAVAGLGLLARRRRRTAGL